MRYRSLLLILMLMALGGCGGEGSDQAAAPSVQAGVLTGLYEGSAGPRRNQLCMIEREGRSASFGFIIWGSRDANCSGSGLVRREGERLRLLPDGDESCAVEAQLDGSKVTLRAPSQECARYYCGGDARIDGAAFDKAGSGEADARRAADLVGEPLCGD